MHPQWFPRIIVCLAILFAARDAAAQNVDPRSIEFGIQFSRFHLDWSAIDRVDSGVGGWVGYPLNDYVVLDGQADFFPSESGTGGTQLQVVGGVKSGLRWERFGVFGKVRPGIVRFGETFGAGCPINTFCALLISVPVTQTNFMLDTGGVVEIYPSPRTVIRTDIGDTMIRFGWRGVFADGDKASSHNFRISVGAGLRF